jgi:hypothetical protein
MSKTQSVHHWKTDGTLFNLDDQLKDLLKKGHKIDFIIPTICINGILNRATIVCHKKDWKDSTGPG